MNVTDFLQHVPAWVVYLLCGLGIGVESIGIPVPGETILMTASILSVRPELGLSPWWIATCACIGAIVGDSIGYLVGEKFGLRLFRWMCRKFPKHVTPAHIAYAEHLFERFGTVAVFGGRFIALMRMLAGPLAGGLRMPYHKFLIANASGGIVWAFGTTFVVHHAGQAAEEFMGKAAWILLLVLLIGGFFATRAAHDWFAEHVDAYAQTERGQAFIALLENTSVQQVPDNLPGHSPIQDHP